MGSKLGPMNYGGKRNLIAPFYAFSRIGKCLRFCWKKAKKNCCNCCKKAKVGNTASYEIGMSGDAITLKKIEQNQTIV